MNLEIRNCAPVLPGHCPEKAHGIHIVAWCPWCESCHRHGAGGANKGIGRRLGDGRDLLSMFEQLYGVPFQIAAAKIIEATTGARIDYRSIRRAEK